MLEKLRIAIKSSYDRVYFTQEVRAPEVRAQEVREGEPGVQEVREGEPGVKDSSDTLENSLVKRLQKRFDWLCGRMHIFEVAGGQRYAPRTQVQRLMQFLGLTYFSNLCDYGFIDVLKYLTRWQDNESAWSNLPRAFLFLIFNLIATVLLTFRNAIRLVTEFLPWVLLQVWLQLGVEVITDLARRIKVASLQFAKSKSGLAQLGLLGLILLQTVVFVALSAIAVATGLWYFVGCAITSPADNMRSAYRTGDHLGNQSFLGKILGVLLATVSILTTACVYAILSPLAIKLVVTQAPTVLPAIANTISQVVGSFSASAGAATANFLTVTLPGFLEGWGAIISAWFATTSASVTGFLSTWLFTAPAIVGLTGLSAVVFSTVSVTTAAMDIYGETSGEEIKGWTKDLTDYVTDFDKVARDLNMDIYDGKTSGEEINEDLSDTDSDSDQGEHDLNQGNSLTAINRDGDGDEISMLNDDSDDTSSKVLFSNN